MKPQLDLATVVGVILDAVVVVVLLLVLAGGVLILAFVPIPDKNQDLFSAIIGGVVGASIMAYINNRYGSSKGSAAKDQTIAALARPFDAGAPTPLPDPNFKPETPS